jgi:hypothetical protein
MRPTGNSVSAPDPQFINYRLREIAAFEARASGNQPAATAAKVAFQRGVKRMTKLFRPAEITTAKLKMALMGFQGSGKTYTATSTAIGLVQLMKSMGLPEGKLPIAFADTEKGSDWILPRVRKAGLDMITAKTRAFSDLIGLINEAENNASFLLVDSLTHFWTELCDTYCAKKAAQYKIPTYRLQFQDWAFLKGEWRKFTDRFVNSNLHIAVCGRAGFEYDYMVDEDTQKKQLEKTGIKFKAEGEMGYEPDLLVLMERKMNMATKADEHVAHVVKDRSTLLDGKEFADPTFEMFLPHIKCLNLGGAQMGIDTSRTSAASIPVDAPRDRGKMQRDIVLGEIQDLLVMHAPGQTVADKQRRITLLKNHFRAGWVEIEESLSLSDLRAGFDTLHIELEGVSSRYGSAIARDLAPAEINDSLPDDCAPDAFKTLSAATGASLTKVDTETLAANGMPKFLVRVPEVQAEPEAPAFDEAAWLTELAKAFKHCIDFVAFSEKQQTLMAPNRAKVSPASWKKAVKLASACMTQLMDNPQSDSALAVAAQ